MICPHCHTELTEPEVLSLYGSLMGRRGKGKTSERKHKSSAENLKKVKRGRKEAGA